jgi:hypothetical protein
MGLKTDIGIKEKYAENKEKMEVLHSSRSHLASLMPQVDGLSEIANAPCVQM